MPRSSSKKAHKKAHKKCEHGKRKIGPRKGTCLKGPRRK